MSDTPAEKTAMNTHHIADCEHATAAIDPVLASDSPMAAQLRAWGHVDLSELAIYAAADYPRRALIPSRMSLTQAAAAAAAGRNDLGVLIRDTAISPTADIAHSLHDTLFGPVLVASTRHGICFAAFADDPEASLADLRARYTGYELRFDDQPEHRRVAAAVCELGAGDPPFRLDLAGTPFQRSVWRALLKIPMGALATYAQVAAEIGRPEASRAVGAAIGANPVAFLIPCHRVIQKTGRIGGFMWGPDRKRAVIAWEGARRHHGPKDARA
ncbi:methylated-DNA--[protein]-cysteine S-methyltransferase [Fulvimarina sp. MAC3]|uniref:methylated-DNA--[protein]-cysteine S-methyltransferase n=1 Tax=Fulvimarina sp. MAC3 TaxID=3148887 RepID=UPI0031FD43A2